MSRQPVTSPRVPRPRDAEVQYTHYLYRLFAADGTLLYIGVTEDVAHRVYMHRQTTVCTGWLTIWTRYDHHTSEAYPTKLAAREAERAAIFAEAPLVNRQHNPKRWRRTRTGWVPLNPADHIRKPSTGDDFWSDLLDGIKAGAA